ncbi:hypothetical protein SLEP1_g4310 [Rubroshorea leprosula]|uniref:mannose-6-phosphate isomerase n=1 Tax=Rubroshorea leprosula TaxID=152421 RepID=A0AAV5HWG0_9ROSI|nr:hypothetical protein SLEP1_g4310 [Rubroshorea leprosula]
MDAANLHHNRKPNVNNPLRLRCSLKNYDWGKIGNHSLVAKLFALNSGSAIDSHSPYAEFWIGTHESGPSFVDQGCENQKGIGNGAVPYLDPVPLKSWLSENPHVLGDKVLEKWGPDLPFLFKVLSVQKALSLQAHPDKELARALHKSLPDVYRDENHKPEMALALTEFEALRGFISSKELKDVFCNVPETLELVRGADKEQFACFINEKGSQEGKAILQSIFSRLMLSTKDEITQMISKMKKRLSLEEEEFFAFFI